MATKNSGNQRLDLLLMERGLASTRTKAQDLIRQGLVKVDGKIITQAGAKYSGENRVELLAEEHPYVSRGGVKLAGALAEFRCGLAGHKVLDIGQSTGGFTDCALRAGAGQVTGVEVGSGQLASALRSDPRVKVFENLDVRQATPELLGAPFSFFTADLSFISLTLVLPTIPRFLVPGAEGIVLVKPQFELSPEEIGSGGIVRDAASREKALLRVIRASENAGFTVAGKTMSPIAGGDGNEEFLLHLRWRS